MKKSGLDFRKAWCLLLRPSGMRIWRDMAAPNGCNVALREEMGEIIVKRVENKNVGEG